MSQRLPGPQNRLLSALATALSIALLAVVAATLESSISTTVAPEPPKSPPTSGISLLALLQQLLTPFLEFFGISLNPASGQLSGNSALGIMFYLLFSLLQIIYQHRLAIIAGVVLLTVLGLLYQYRYHLTLPRVFQSSSETTEPSDQSSSAVTTSASWPAETSPDSVQDVWITMIQHVNNDVEKPASKTPTEWQQISIDAGLPVDAVETITTTFCTIQYGTTSETEAHLERVQAALNQLDTRQEATNE